MSGESEDNELLSLAKPKLSQTEFNSLHDFYNATNGRYWQWHNISAHSSVWNFSNPNANPCLDNWQGLTCSCGLKICTVSILYLDHHNLSGHLPDSMENFDTMLILVLRGNNITGSITESIGNITTLQVLDLSYNMIHGKIPVSVGRLAQLQTLNLGVNRLTAIPIELYNLKVLRGVSLLNNRIEGIISPHIGNLSSLETLQLQQNKFSLQTIPSQLCKLRALKTLDLSNNDFYGSFPLCLFDMKNLTSLTILGTNISCTINEAIGNLTNLISLDLSFSPLFGAIPNTIGNLVNLKQLTFNGNLLSGPVPHSILQLQNLQSLSFQYNLLDGKIDFLASMNLSIFYFHNNAFTGHFEVPSTGLLNVKFLDLSVNSFSGPLPCNPNWEMIQVYEVYANYFSSTLPSFLNSFQMFYFVATHLYLSSSIPNDFLVNANNNLFYIGLTSTLLSGTLPAVIGHFYQLNQLLLAHNEFIGTLPILSNVTKLVVLDVSFNRLTGRVTSSLRDLVYLKQIFVQNNAFTGRIEGFVNATRQKRLVNIDVSANELTGTLPYQIFTEVENLNTFSATSNCLSGSIPVEICESNSLVSLSLDGLSTSNNCKQVLFPGLPFFTGFTVSQFIEGTIPSCLFNMPNLQLLHLSGNGLKGTIAEQFPKNTSVTYLSLSHNSLSGFIPEEIQLRSWNVLDLSYNKLTGTLSDSFAPTYSESSIFLEVNRLSGIIPSNLVNNASDVNILSGNIFTCDFLGNNLPPSDPDAENYSCGSDNVNNVLYGWIGVIFFAPFLAFAFIRLTKSELASLKEVIQLSYNRWGKWRATLRENQEHVHLVRLSIYFSEVRRGTLALTIYCIFILLPLFSILKIYSSSYSIEYAWSVSAMLMNGETAAILLFFALIILVILYTTVLKTIVKRLNRRMPKDHYRNNSISSTAESVRSVISENNMETYLVYSGVSLLNLIVMVAVDFSYVYIVISYDTIISTLAALGLALFRLGTNHLLLWHALPITKKLLARVKGISRKKNSDDGSAIPLHLSADYSAKDISFLENLTLFNNIIIPGIAIVFILPDCFYNALFAANQVTSSYQYEICYQQAAYSDYTHLCSTYDSIVTYSPPFIYSYQCSSKIIMNYVPVYVLMFIIAGIFIPLLKISLKVIDQILLKRERRAMTSSFSASFIRGLRMMIAFLLPAYFRELSSIGLNNIDCHESSEDKRSSRRLFTKRKQLFSKFTMTVQMNSYLTIFMCFGSLFPPLAFIAAISIYSITYFEELCIGWLLTETRALGVGYEWYEEQIEKECAGVEESSDMTIWSTLTVSCGLYGYVIFDTMGDTSGWRAALPMTLIMISLPLILFVSIRCKGLQIPTLLSDDIKDNPRTSSLHEKPSDDTSKSPDLELTSTNQIKKKTTISIVENPLF